MNAARLKAWEDAAIGYYGLVKIDQNAIPPMATYWIKPNPTDANTPSDVVRDLSKTDYYVRDPIRADSSVRHPPVR